MAITSFKKYLFFFLLSLCVLFFLSPDSYTHDLYDRVDTGWFFTCGKAWMNGMIPYIDFADSKGPLLWFIYGIGYLISPYNYIGIFWISVFLYAAIFYLVYKIALIFIKDEREAMGISVMMIFFFFCRWYHYEIRAEDFNILFISLLFYRSCFFLYTEKGKENKNVYITCFTIGVTLSSTLLIKYNATVMIGLTSFYLLYAIIREKKNLILSFLAFFTGCLIVLLPFVFYMYIAGNFNAFIQEYFLNTMQTIDSFNNLSTYLKEWLYLTYDTLYIILFFTSLIGTILIGRTVTKYKYFFLISFLCFYAISIHHSSSVRIQYMDILLFFPIWTCISFALLVKKHIHKYRTRLSYLTFLLLGYTLFSNMFNQGYLCQSLFFNNNDGRKYYYEVAYFISQINKPTIIYYGDLERGIGTAADALPGSKYWSIQMHPTEEMLKTQTRDVLSGSSDFILTCDFDKSMSMRIKDSLLVAAGYHKVYHHYYGVSNHFLYTKHQLAPLPSNFHVSNIDVILKRNPLDKYKKGYCTTY